MRTNSQTCPAQGGWVGFQNLRHLQYFNPYSLALDQQVSGWWPNHCDTQILHLHTHLKAKTGEYLYRDVEGTLDTLAESQGGKGIRTSHEAESLRHDRWKGLFQEACLLSHQVTFRWCIVTPSFCTPPWDLRSLYTLLYLSRASQWR